MTSNQGISKSNLSNTPAGYIKAIQVHATFGSEHDARLAFGFLLDQVDCYAGRCYYSDKDQVWAVQTMNAPGDDWEVGAELPESMRYVLCPTSLLSGMQPAAGGNWRT